MALPIKAMVDDKFKGQSLVALMRGSENEKDVQEFERFCKLGLSTTVDGGSHAGSGEEQDNNENADREESTIMEGFRYRVNDTAFPVYRGKKKLEDFPIIPIGMLDVWREEDQADELGF